MGPHLYLKSKNHLNLQIQVRNFMRTIFLKRFLVIPFQVLTKKNTKKVAF